MLDCSEINVTIRKAKKEDMIQVYKLIKELAEFEKLEDQVKIDEKTLIKDGFETDNPVFTCLVAEISDGHLVGYALYYTSYSTWLGKSVFLEDLYVQPAYRKIGIGKQLFMAVAKTAHELSSKRLDFHVLSWNPAIDFYKSLGAENLTVSEKWQLFRLNEQALNKMFS
ncbi:thialysine N-epsilon-acetyltransferase [Tribolium castaneum]|uniref:Diamine acetyltransferase 2-like Protein n=1 Tax=Tribolium castaneum TaxID=7070 RepID=D6WL85_TRICA|nr:PREDICTED: diamine acetyltransferase 2 [Tribolium castaneum]XP_973786.1 PREDICTED: diamine acetyltransferase 2 [Tribolium castaneum]EFA03491.1 Diamine acetyltransferase 2-like Protein [Tribolium castaneum]|eukprot:XP_015835878.1 PREDICTED: diamine acetyltransferase 2 [Tribolium castaneum]